jgi:hypothetical protein
MSDMKVEQYKKGVEKAVDRWKGKIEKIGEKADKLRQILAKLKEIKNPTTDDKKKIADCQKGFDALDKEVDKATQELKLDVMLLDVPKEAPKAELLKLPDWLKGIIKAKGIPLGKGVSIAPDIDFDFKNFKLKSLGVQVRW